jgi:hypothetical protein
MNMDLRGHGIGRDQLRQGGGRGTGNDHVEDLYGCTELYVYQPPNKKVTGYESLKLFIESEGCEIIFTADAPPELNSYETMRITHRQGHPIPNAVVKRIHSWSHQRNFLHSFFKPLYR